VWMCFVTILSVEFVGELTCCILFSISRSDEKPTVGVQAWKNQLFQLGICSTRKRVTREAAARPLATYAADKALKVNYEWPCFAPQRRVKKLL
jgi:hypothetical protein